MTSEERIITAARKLTGAVLRGEDYGNRDTLMDELDVAVTAHDAKTEAFMEKHRRAMRGDR